ncbi:pitrilysin family protein [Undibacterium sp.]|uniref:M16 family metallopeptidase n=1 Tax=Undibacterium sp. TaxID=1914977 RepID=UPI002C87135D|nr:pitrilysin family protein [Undibacterium sp.]HTD04000.1 pitrilysin family protein [Undibacterium sp.]
MTMFVRRNTILAASLALISLGAVAQQAAPAKEKPATATTTAAKPSGKMDIAIPDIPYTKFVLKNGLTVLVHEDHKAPIVAVNTWYHVGSKNEKPGKTGFAHLFEHLMFSGSDNFNHTYINAMERIGATNLNGTTNNDRTNYFENVPTSMLDYTLFAESDRMGHLLGVLDQKKLDLQRGVVQNEKRQGENQPYGVAEQLLVENTYPVGHPYSWTVIGSMKDLDAASMEDVREWFKTNYGPNNVTLVLAGDITPEVARQKVEKYYGDIPAGPPLAKHEAWIAKRTGTHRGTVQDRVPQARLYRVWNTPGAYTKEQALLDLAAHVLGGGKTSRLYKRLVYQDQIATSATAGSDGNEIGGQFDLTLTARPNGDLDKVEKTADEELQKFLKGGVTEQELQLAKTAILARYVRIVERIGGFGGKSDLLASCTTYTGNPDCYKDYLKWIKEATPASIKKAANDWLSDGDYVLSVTPYPTSLTASAKQDRSKEPPLGQPESLKLPAMQKATLSNGLKVVLAERHTAPVVNFSMMFDSGYASDSANLPGVASLSLRMLEEGTPTRGSLKIGEELEALGANFTAGTNLDAAFVNLNVLKATMPKGLDIYSDLLLHPAFPEKDFERLKKDRLAGIQREKSNPQTMALRVVPELLYGKGHPYGLPLTGTGTEAAVTKMTREDLVKYHSTWFKPNNATLLIVGDTTLAEITPLLEKAFAGWKAGEVPKKNITEVKQPEKTVVYLIDRPGALQSMIVSAQLAPPRNAADAVPLQIVNNVFGGSFSSRINMNLREDKHWSYGVSAQILSAVGQRPYLSRSPVQTDKTKEALQELVQEYANVTGAKPITAEELKDAQTNETLGLPGSFETAGQLSGAYSQILQYKLPDNYYNTFTQNVMSLTPDQANALAKRYVLPKQLIWVVVGDMSKVEAGIRSLNLGEVHKIDADGNPVK